MRENPLSAAIHAAVPDPVAEEQARIALEAQREEERLMQERRDAIKAELERLKGCVDDDTFMGMTTTVLGPEGPKCQMWGDREVLVASALRVVLTYQKATEKARKEAEGAGLIVPAGVQRPGEDNGPRIIVPGA